MKILLICHEYPPLGGGGGRQSMNLAKEYARHHKVYFLTVGFHEYGICQKDGYTLHRLSAKRKRVDKPSNIEFLSFVLEAWRHLPQIMKRFSPGVVHCFFSIPEGLLLFHPRLRGIPSVISVRGADVPGHDPDRFPLLYKIVRPIVRKIWKKTNRLVCNSNDLKKEVLFISPELKVQVIPNGIDTQRFEFVKRKKNSQKLVLLFVGRIIPLKRIDIVIKAVAELRRKFDKKSLIFRIVGIGWQRSLLEALTNELHLNEQVIFVGGIDYEKIHKEYCKADIYIQLSIVEGMSNSVLEAMASGLPVITTNVGGASELIRDNGFIIDDISVETVVACIGKYLQTPSLLEIHGYNSRILAQQLDFVRISGHYLDVLLSCVPESDGSYKDAS